MKEPAYSTIQLGHWKEFKTYVERFSRDWAFRGQENAAWALNNAIERTRFIRFYKGIEAEFVAEFQRGASNYLSADDAPGKLIEWLALMQHYGAPTRLLDLTRSPFIAAYFAYEFCPELHDYHVAVWGINIQFLREKALEVLRDEFGEALAENKDLINETLFEKIFYQNNKRLVFPVEPFSMNRRYSLQQSVFISSGISDVPMMEQFAFLGADVKKAIVKIELPSMCRKQALRDLQQMNLNRASLFPHLDGYAVALRLRYDSMQTPEEAMEEKAEKILRHRDELLP